MSIVVLHNKINSSARKDELDTLKQVQAVKRALQALDYDVKVVECDLNLEKLQHKLEKYDIEFVFNLVESLADKIELLHVIPSLLDAKKIPYTGSNANSIFLTTQKVLAKQLMQSFSIPSAPWFVLGSEECKNFKAGPYIIKPIWEDASVGITEDSVFDCKSVVEVLDAIQAKETDLVCECFAEEYIDGKEFNVSLLEVNRDVHVLPIAEMKFFGFEGKREVLTYTAKWVEESIEYQSTCRSFDLNHIDANLINQLKELSLACWKNFNLKGYARIDFRVDRNNQPYVLEINANPCIAENAGFIAAGLQENYSYIQIIDYICQAAVL